MAVGKDEALSSNLGQLHGNPLTPSVFKGVTMFVRKFSLTSRKRCI